MNEEAQSLIEKKEQELRRMHLISLGFINEKATEKVKEKLGALFNKFKDAVPIYLTDEEYNEICKFYPLDRRVRLDYKKNEDISNIKFWVKLWSIVSIVAAAISIIVALVIIAN
ncbi:MAG: hypothetical protein WC135_02800 [Bacteroidales bacterium]